MFGKKRRKSKQKIACEMVVVEGKWEGNAYTPVYKPAKTMPVEDVINVILEHLGITFEVIEATPEKIVPKIKKKAVAKKKRRT